MKPFKLILALALVLTITLISSCSKDDDPILSRLELLTQKPWKLKSTTIVGIGTSPPESYSADDIHTFNTDGTYVFDEGPTKEDSSDPQTVNGKWEFAEAETIIKLSYGGLTLNQEIVELTSTTLKVKFNFIFDLEETFGH
ncbi:MAG TPA: DUF5004 domain-containing protein [Cyclobacteriaceae bacterium]|nr:DUF5004 domain-containing protein [Cyclobacteriaceae bacterium]HRK52870.1 DUF5004 domain-containing protein [Cyclobacteriaceae bacterium]